MDVWRVDDPRRGVVLFHLVVGGWPLATVTLTDSELQSAPSPARLMRDRIVEVLKPVALTHVPVHDQPFDDRRA